MIVSRKKNNSWKFFNSPTNVAFLSIGVSFIILGLNDKLYLYSGIIIILLTLLDTRDDSKEDKDFDKDNQG